jgi:hypothetical protein
MAKPPAAQHATTFDRIAAVCAGLAIVGVVLFLVIRNEEIAGTRLFLALRVMLSLAAAVLGGTIPGFLEIGWKTQRDRTIRAGGALALFVLTFVYTPDDPGQRHPEISAPGGVAAGTISGGTFNIQDIRKPKN